MLEWFEGAGVIVYLCVGKFCQSADMVGMEMGDDDVPNFFRAYAGLLKQPVRWPRRRNGCGPAVEPMGNFISGSVEASTVARVDQYPTLSCVVESEKDRRKFRPTQRASVDERQELTAMTAGKSAQGGNHSSKMATA
jgi:hypothetical protein